MDNVIVQIKNGPMDFQIREPVSPLFGAMERPMLPWNCRLHRSILASKGYVLPGQYVERGIDFDTYAKGRVHW